MKPRAIKYGRLLQIGAASRYIGRHQTSLRRMVDRGEIPCFRDGRRRVFKIEDLDAWIDRRPSFDENPPKRLDSYFKPTEQS